MGDVMKTCRELFDRFLGRVVKLLLVFLVCITGTVVRALWGALTGDWGHPVIGGLIIAGMIWGCYKVVTWQTDPGTIGKNPWWRPGATLRTQVCLSNFGHWQQVENGAICKVVGILAARSFHEMMCARERFAPPSRDYEWNFIRTETIGLVKHEDEYVLNSLQMLRDLDEKGYVFVPVSKTEHIPLGFFGVKDIDPDFFLRPRG